MSILSRLFGRKPRADPPAFAPRVARVDVHRGLDVHAHRDVIAGYQFFATMQLRTPLRVLRRHGEVHHGIDSEPPEIAKEMWEGCWVPKTRTFRELGLDIDEPSFATMSSDVGMIPRDGGDYLKFLLSARGAAEGTGAIEDRRAAVARVLSDPAWRKWVQALGGGDAILNRLFPPFVSTIPRMSAKAATALMNEGYGSPNSINAASDPQLQAVSGVGPVIVTALRSAASTAAEPASRFVDRVIR